MACVGEGKLLVMQKNAYTLWVNSLLIARENVIVIIPHDEHQSCVGLGHRRLINMHSECVYHCVYYD